MLKNNNQRAKRLIIILTIIFVINIVSIISDLMQYTLLNSPNGISIEEAETNDLRQTIIGAITVCVFILSFIFFIQWFRRAYNNLHQVVKYLEFEEGWAAGAWFVPFLNLYRPYQIMKELYVETEKYIQKIDTSYTKKLNLNLVGIWWFLWITASVLERIGMRLNLKAETLDDFTNATIINLINGFFTIPLCLIIIKLIRDYNEVESKLFEIENSTIISESTETIVVLEE